MIIGLVCNCTGSENMVRSVFHDAGLSNWLDITVLKGDRAKDFVAKAIEQRPKSVALKALYSHIKDRGSFSVVLGIDEEVSLEKWSDVADGEFVSMAEATVIANKFA